MGTGRDLKIGTSDNADLHYVNVEKKIACMHKIQNNTVLCICEFILSMASISSRDYFRFDSLSHDGFKQWSHYALVTLSVDIMRFF